LSPFYRLGGATSETPRSFRQSVMDAVNHGVIPIGLSAAVSGLFLVLLFYLN